jgi:hypothetical protein
MPSRRQRVSGIVAAGIAVLVGAVAVGVGAGIGLPFAAERDTLLVTVVALFCLGLGAALLGWGAVRLVRSFHGWARVPAIAVVVMMTIPLVFAFGMATATTYVPRVALGDETPSDRGLAYREVWFTATDGVELAGWYVPSTNGAAVILLHGAHSTRSAVLDHAAALAKHGYGVLLYDARGHGVTAGAVPDEGHAAAHIQAGSPATVQVWTATGAGHTRALAVHPAEWEDRLVSFLAHALGLP